MKNKINIVLLSLCFLFSICFSSAYLEGYWYQSGNSLTISETRLPSITSLNSTRIAFIDDINDQLRTYDWNGTDWNQNGNSLAIGVNRPSITSLNSTRIAFIDDVHDQLRTYDWNGTNWNQNGNSLAISGVTDPSITSLNSTRIAFIDYNNDQLRTYDWNGTDWSQNGNSLVISGVIFSSITSLNSTRIAFIDTGNDQLRTYDWNGTDWSMFGNGLNITNVGTPSTTSLSSSRIAFIDGTNDQLRTYDWNETDWSQNGNSLVISGIGSPSITSLNSTRIAFIDDSNDQLRTYDWIEKSGTITLNYPTALIDYGKVNGTLQLNFTATDTNLDKVWYNYNGTNVTIAGAVTGVANLSNITLSTKKNVTIYANDTAGNIASEVFSWDYKVFENSISYSSQVIEGEPTQINGSFTLSQVPTSIKLIYDGAEFTPSLTSSGLTYNTTSSVYAPQVTGNENISFYYEIVVGGETIITDLYEHLVLDVSVSTNCSGGTFPLLTFLNFDEDTRLSLNGTVEYSLSLLNNNVKVASTNGTTNGFNVSLCTNLNLSQSFARYELGLRYYKASEYFYETYNIENSAASNLPLSINLYFLNMSKGVQFKINYKDFNYLTHPGALIQIQRQYLDEDLYRLVELPKISDEGQAIGAFSIDNVRYKLIVIEDGEILDTFENIFPVCQNIVLGTCELNLRGDEEVEVIEDDDFIYSIFQGNNSITLTYVIPSGTPKSVSLLTTQDSRFITNLSSCTQTQFGSGATLTCGYNNTVGDSLIDVEVIINGASKLKGTLKQQENLQPFFLTNNYFIAFILLLTLALIFISSGVMMVLSGVVGLFYLGFIYLINASSLNITTIASSVMWLLIAVGLILYKIAQKEERT